VYPNQFPGGIKNRISNKIQQQNIVLPYSGSNETNLPPNNTLSSLISVQQSTPQSSSYTADINYVEVAFSPQNEINNDIAGQLGYFNIGEYIGDPRLVSSSAESYPLLDNLRNNYFEKYISNYNWMDYIRLIKYYDSSLFKIIKDFTPARSGLASGIVIKQHLLERNKYPVPQIDTLTTTSYQYLNDPFVLQNLEITGSPINMYEITGSAGGVVPSLTVSTIPFESASAYTNELYPGAINITQSWTGSTPSLLGYVPFTESTSTEFYDGEFSGSIIEITNGELNPECNPIKSASTIAPFYEVSGSLHIDNFYNFAQAENYILDHDGSIQIFFAKTSSYYYDPGYASFIQDTRYYISGLGMARQTLDNLDLGDYIPQMIQFVLNVNYSPSDFTLSGTWSPAAFKQWIGNANPTLIITNIQEKIGINSGDPYYLMQCVPNTNSYFKITQEDIAGSGLITTGSVYVTPKTPILTVFGPFVPPTFQDSNCNAVYGNVVLNRTSSVYFDVDYSENGTVAINNESILNQTSPKAEVQNSNYTLLRQINPRYLGSKNSSPAIQGQPSSQDFWLGEGQTALYPFNLTSGNQNPAVEQLTRIGIYYEWAGGTNPEIPGLTGFKIKYIFDENGNITTPNISSSFYGDLIEGFPAESSVSVIPYNTLGSTMTNDNVSDAIGGIQKVYVPGVYVNSYLTSQSGSAINGGYNTSSLYLQTWDGNEETSQTLGNPLFPYWFTTQSFYGNTEMSPSTFIGQQSVSTYTAIINPSSTIYTQETTNSVESLNYNNNSQFSWKQIPNSGSNPNRSGFDDTISPLTFSPFLFRSGAIPGSYTWFTGSFSPYPDRIRIQATSSNDYFNTEIKQANFGYTMTGYIQFKDPVPTQFIEANGRINELTFLRLTPDATLIYLDVAKPAGAAGPGFIMPQYPSQTLKDNFPSIIENLSNKGLI